MNTYNDNKNNNTKNTTSDERARWEAFQRDFQKSQAQRAQQTSNPREFQQPQRNNRFQQNHNNNFQQPYSRSNSRPVSTTNEPTQRHKSSSNNKTTRRRKKTPISAYLMRFLVFILLPLLIIWGVFTFISGLFNDSSSDTETVSTEITETVPSEILVPEEPSNKVSLLAVGDNVIHERLFTYADKNKGESNDGTYDFLPSYQYMNDQISAADIAFINQETIIGGDEIGPAGYPAFNTPEQMAADLSTLGFDVVNGASNHSLDKGYSALANSIDIWNQYEDVSFIGLYDSPESNNTIPIIERNGIRFAFLAYTFSLNGAELDMPNDYCVKLFDEEVITQDVQKAKEISDVVIASAHWGVENDYTLNSLQTGYAQLFADLEVDLVIGHHPHVIQPLEWIEGKNKNQTLVAYSLGNFLSTMETVDTQLQGMLSLDFVKKEEDVTIENVVWTPLINHFGDGTFNVRPLHDYTDELNASHLILADQCPNAIETFTKKTEEIIGSEFTIDPLLYE